MQAYQLTHCYDMRIATPTAAEACIRYWLFLAPTCFGLFLLKYLDTHILVCHVTRSVATAEPKIPHAILMWSGKGAVNSSRPNLMMTRISVKRIAPQSHAYGPSLINTFWLELCSTCSQSARAVPARCTHPGAHTTGETLSDCAQPLELDNVLRDARMQACIPSEGRHTDGQEQRTLSHA